MKITYVITRSEIGGAQNHVLSLISGLDQEFDLTLVTSAEGYLTENLKKMGVSYYLLPELDSFRFWSAIPKLYGILKATPSELIHTHSSFAGLYGRCCAKILGRRTVHTVHGWHFLNQVGWTRSRVLLLVELLLRPLTDYWITVSRFDMEVGLKKLLLRRSDSQFIPNGIPEWNSLREDPRMSVNLSVLMIGRAGFQKNLGAAVTLMERTVESVELAIFTSGDQVGELEVLVQASPAKKRITIIKNKDTSQLDLSCFDVMMITSRYEGMPLSVLEGMRAGLAVVSTNVCGMSELVDEGNGFLVDPDHIEEISSCLNTLDRDRNLVRKLGDDSRKKYLENHTVEQMVSQTRSVYFLVASK